MQAKHHSSREVIPGNKNFVVKLRHGGVCLYMVVVGPTLVIVRRVLDGRGEDADLAEEHGDQEGGASGVGGGG